MRLPYVAPTDTPITDNLYDITGGEPLATWNRLRGRLGSDGRRQVGGEWDAVRSLPLRVRRKLTGARYMSAHGPAPDQFAEIIRHRVPGEDSMTDDDVVAWYVREALRAIRERRTARQRDVKRAIAKRAGVNSYYEYRRLQAQAAGFDSFWAYRQHRKWEE